MQPPARVWCHGDGDAQQWSLELDSRIARLADARLFAEGVVDAAGLLGTQRYLLVVAVHEAVVNAMLHGSRFETPVRITACLDAEGVSFAVADQGPAFAFPAVATAAPLERGRGLPLMTSGVDEISQQPLAVGKEIRLTKWLRPRR